MRGVNVLKNKKQYFLQEEVYRLRYSIEDEEDDIFKDSDLISKRYLVAASRFTYMVIENINLKHMVIGSLYKIKRMLKSFSDSVIQGKIILKELYYNNEATNQSFSYCETYHVCEVLVNTQKEIIMVVDGGLGPNIAIKLTIKEFDAELKLPMIL